MATVLPLVDPKMGWWVTGLTDGEGCFYADLSFRSKGTSSGNTVSCVSLDAQFSVALRADDADILHSIHDFFGCGNVREKPASTAPSTRKYGLKPNPQVIYRVAAYQDLIDKVIPHFERFPLQTKKRHDFDMFRRILEFTGAELRGKKQWATKHSHKLEELSELCTVLKTGRRYASGE